MDCGRNGGQVRRRAICGPIDDGARSFDDDHAWRRDDGGSDVRCFRLDEFCFCNNFLCLGNDVFRFDDFVGNIKIDVETRGRMVKRGGLDWNRRGGDRFSGTEADCKGPSGKEEVKGFCATRRQERKNSKRDEARRYHYDSCCPHRVVLNWFNVEDWQTVSAS